MSCRERPGQGGQAKPRAGALTLLKQVLDGGCILSQDSWIGMQPAIGKTQLLAIL